MDDVTSKLGCDQDVEMHSGAQGPQGPISTLHEFETLSLNATAVMNPAFFLFFSSEHKCRVAKKTRKEQINPPTCVHKRVEQNPALSDKLPYKHQ
jgi:hypothetical protein